MCTFAKSPVSRLVSILYSFLEDYFSVALDLCFYESAVIRDDAKCSVP